jgi:hypothetical protein
VRAIHIHGQKRNTKENLTPWLCGPQGLRIVSRGTRGRCGFSIKATYISGAGYTHSRAKKKYKRKFNTLVVRPAGPFVPQETLRGRKPILACLWLFMGNFMDIHFIYGYLWVNIWVYESRITENHP